MAKAKQEQQPKRSTGRKRTGEQASSSTQEDEDVVESFRNAAEKQLVQRSDRIAEALGEKAENGDLSSAKFLLTEVMKRAGTKAKKQGGKSVVQKLAEEPPWEGQPAKTGQEFEDCNGDPEA